MLKKNDEIQLEITDVNSLGSGVGRYEDMAVFVPMTAIGDTILCRIVKVCRSYCYGIISSVITPSPDRYDRGCDVYKKCGGCTFRHISYEAEKRIKLKGIQDAFRRVGGFEQIPFDVFIGCEDTDRYRNKAQYPLAQKDGRIFCGFFSAHSHRVIECDDCLLQPKIFSEITAFCTGSFMENHLSVYNEESGKGLLRHIYIRQGHHTKEIMVCIVATGRHKALDRLAKEIMQRFPDIRSVVLNINPDRTNVILGKECITLGGKDHIEDIMCENRIRLSPHSFYQVNTAQAERLYEKAAEYADAAGTELLDLYCGTGTIGLFMARQAKSVTGVEIVPQAVDNAKENARINGIENAVFTCADAAKAAQDYAKRGKHPDVIITDPPRKGCDELTLSSMVKMAPKRIVMVSCNPQTAARDIKYLTENGYEMQKISGVDLYAGTAHVETVVCLDKKK